MPDRAKDEETERNERFKNRCMEYESYECEQKLNLRIMKIDHEAKNKCRHCQSYTNEPRTRNQMNDSVKYNKNRNENKKIYGIRELK